ncbi:hypothetical protein [Glutamicibacter sp. BSL13]
MASFGEVRLGTQGAAVFELASASNDERFEHQFEDGSQALIPSAGNYIVVRNCPGEDYKETHESARKTANQALDLHFSQGGRPLQIAHEERPYIVCWVASGHRTLRIIGQAQVTTSLKANSVAFDLNGNVIAPTAPLLQAWHESLRYYRASEASTDLYDSFRNLYLALEALLSQLVPNDQGKKESEWIKGALNTIHKTLDLTPFAPSTHPSASNAIFNELYCQMRTAIFHAKRGRPTWIPQDWQSREAVTEARFRYAQLFRALAAEELNTRFSIAGPTPALLALMHKAAFKGNQFFVSNDPTNLDDLAAGEHGLALAGGTYIKLPTSITEDNSSDLQGGVADIEETAKIHKALGKIHKFGTLGEGEKLMIVEDLRASLTLDEIDELQITLLVDVRKFGAPKKDFTS